MAHRGVTFSGKDNYWQIAYALVDNPTHKHGEALTQWATEIIIIIGHEAKKEMHGIM